MARRMTTVQEGEVGIETDALPSGSLPIVFSNGIDPRNCIENRYEAVDEAWSVGRLIAGQAGA